MSRASALTDAIESGIIIPPDIKKTINSVNLNLYEGPSLGTFSQEALDQIRNWFDDLPTYYYDENCGMVTTSEFSHQPDDPDFDGQAPEIYPEIETSTIKQVLLGAVAEYI